MVILNPNLAPITQAQLKKYFELKQLVEQFTALEQEIKIAYKAGAPTKKGPFVLFAKERKGQRRPQWKDEAVKLADSYGLDGNAWAEKIVENTPPGAPSISLEVVDTRGSV